MQRLTRDIAGDRTGRGYDNQRALGRRGRLPADVLREQRRGKQEKRRHVEIRGPFAVLSEDGGKSK